MAKQGPRKKLPKELAVINADNCTGCESCLEVCPVDCIFKVQQYDQFHNLQSWCEIDIERCVGCEVCVHIPGKKTNPYDLKVCPWDAIEMVPTEEVAVAVAEMGGPPEYVQENWDRLVDTAQHLAELKAAKETGVEIFQQIVIFLCDSRPRLYSVHKYTPRAARSHHVRIASSERYSSPS